MIVAVDLTVITVSANPKLVTAVGSVLQVETTTALRGLPSVKAGSGGPYVRCLSTCSAPSSHRASGLAFCVGGSRDEYSTCQRQSALPALPTASLCEVQALLTGRDTSYESRCAVTGILGRSLYRATLPRHRCAQAHCGLPPAIPAFRESRQMV